MPNDAAPTLTTRMLAEALRVFEADGREPVADDVAATSAGKNAAGDPEAKIIARAQATQVSKQLRPAIARLGRVARLLVAALLVAILVVGAGAARAALGLGAESRVNFFHAIGTLLGVQTLILIIWIVVMLWHPGSVSSFSLGAMLRWLVDLVMRKSSNSKAHLAALEGATVVYASPKLAKWTLSSLSHAAWTAFNLGCVAMLLMLLSTRYYTFVWETTILSDKAYAPIVETIAALPRQVGFEAPTPEQVAASEWNGTPSVATTDEATLSRAWSGLLVGSIVVYGALPRFALLLFCLWRMSAARRRYRLDQSRAGFAILVSRLSPREQLLGVVDPDEQHGDATGTLHEAPNTTVRPAGPPAIVGLELDRPRTWPPSTDGLKLTDLGIANDRPDRHRVIQQLQAAAKEPSVLVIACSLTSTPDRGLGSIIAELRRSVSRPVFILLTGGQSLRDRGNAETIARRVDDWHTLAAQSGVQRDQVIELDLDHTTHASLAQLGNRISGSSSQAPTERRIDSAFNTIARHAESWSAAPSHRQQLALHQEILRLYGDAPSVWRALIADPPSLSELSSDTAGALRKHADRAVSLLPPQLQIKPKWAIAGASAGALGCIAAAAFAAPAVIGALPLWTGIGAAIASAASTFTKKATASESRTDKNEGGAFDEAVRAAALNALLLELQGRSESAISRILERTLSESRDHESSIDSADVASHWLSELKHRFDMALAEGSLS